MNNDRISNTPGGERMLFGGIVAGFAFFAWQGLRFELGGFGHLLLLVLTGIGLVQFGRGLIDWKYTNPKTYAANRPLENLYVDIPLGEYGTRILHRVEDALIEAVRSSDTLSIHLQSVDTANNVGTLHLTGRNADAMFAHLYATLAGFAKPGGLNLFPPQGQEVDAEVRGKRVMLIVPEGKNF